MLGYFSWHFWPCITRSWHQTLLLMILHSQTLVDDSWFFIDYVVISQIAKFMGPTSGSPGTCRPHEHCYRGCLTTRSHEIMELRDMALKWSDNLITRNDSIQTRMAFVAFLGLQRLWRLAATTAAQWVTKARKLKTAQVVVRSLIRQNDNSSHWNKMIIARYFYIYCSFNPNLFHILRLAPKLGRQNWK